STPTHLASDQPINTIAGFPIPEEPRPPADDAMASVECCMSGCAVCVYDLYEDSLKEYKQAVATLRASLSALSIPESRWPSHIRMSTTATDEHATSANRQRDAVFSAFDEMERTLKEKREKRAAVEAES
ncbi:hypothetical protein ID866_7795, partial [Astraeus odoratus]